MSNDEIIRMAQEAGLMDWNGQCVLTDGQLERFFLLAAAAGAAAERETANSAYRERNQLVALLSTLFPSGKAKTAIEGWDEAWHGCVYIDFPWGQASWHYHTDDEWMFEHLPAYTKPWDGHTTEAKYAAIAAAIRARSKE